MSKTGGDHLNIAVLGAVIGVISAIFGMFISYFTFTRGRDKDVHKKAKEEGRIETQLAAIGEGVNEIRIDLKANEKQMSRMNEQIIRVDESTKSAHKRIDKLEGK